MIQTPWKKSRTYGDIHGGRMRLRITNNIFQRLHSLQLPGPGDTCPLLIEENPSRDFYFPISAVESLEVLRTHSAVQMAGLTHIWLRRHRCSHRDLNNQAQAEFICGSGVRVIILYPWRVDGELPLGTSKPTAKQVKPFKSLGSSVHKRQGYWFVSLNQEQARQYYVQHLLLHEFAHHIDWFQRYWSKANHKQVEEFANQYAVRWGSEAIEILNNLNTVELT